MPVQDRSSAMEAFRDRAMRRSPIPVPGVPPAPGGGAPQPSPGAPPGGGQPQPSGEIGILKQVTGKVTESEMIEVLIRRLKKLMPKEGEGGANVTA